MFKGHVHTFYSKGKKFKIQFTIFIKYFTSTKQTRLLDVSIENHK